jgi:NADPH-dependent ferric siderophore reductase
MASGKALLGSVLGKLIFREAEVMQVREVSPHFREIQLASPALVNAGWRPGDKVQVFLPGLGMRTYTPMSWDLARGTTRFLVYLHGATPGAEWARRVQVGDRCQLFGPRRSIELDSSDASVVFFGDESSFAVAHALHQAHPEVQVSWLFEVSYAEESLGVLRELGLEGARTVERTPGETHLPELAGQLQAMLASSEGARLFMTGKAQSIQALRTRLKADGVSRGGKVKAYWSVGKEGLD